MPTPSSFASDAEELFTSWLASRDAGTGADFEEWCRGYPEHEPALRSLWRRWARLQGVLDRAGLVPPSSDANATKPPAKGSEAAEASTPRK